MLSKETLKYLSLRIDRALARGSPTGQPLAPLCYRVRVPKDKLDLLVGTFLKDRYFVLSILGKGGMSLVYRAKDMHTGKIVALKALRTQGMGDEVLVKRFRLEAEVLHRLNHPRIVSVHDYGTSKHGQPFFVMDYLIGVSLNQVLKREGALKPERFQDIFVQVAAAIAHAHKHGAIHRDIKPGNIMLVEMGDTRDYVKIVDFGIAKLAEDAAKLTRMGEVWGSPIYMSPEQGMGTTIDARTDIYSLGVVMYESLTGEVPFLGRNYVETMTMQISEPPAPFSDVCPELKIPAALEMIVFRALQKSPDERYQSMNEMKSDLERALNTANLFCPDDRPESTGSRPVWGFMKKKVEEIQVAAPADTILEPIPPGQDMSPGSISGSIAIPEEKGTGVDEITRHLVRGVSDPEIVSASTPMEPFEATERNSPRLESLIKKTSTLEPESRQARAPERQEEPSPARRPARRNSGKTTSSGMRSNTGSRMAARSNTRSNTGSRISGIGNTGGKMRTGREPASKGALAAKILIAIAAAGIVYGVAVSPDMRRVLIDFIYKTDWGEKPPGEGQPEL
ncbi:MAG: serine/threonine protein kinase [Candidatus Melainabacteria bacterium]|nr:serine/threonine protein kinase [Candidatus Melainabacteria bacterium]